MLVIREVQITSQGRHSELNIANITRNCGCHLVEYGNMIFHVEKNVLVEVDCE